MDVEKCSSSSVELKTLWAIMKRETESSPYRVLYITTVQYRESFKNQLQFFSVKCFTYETENIDTQAI